jgi:nucleotide-binding universal stress UspA family protein
MKNLQEMIMSIMVAYDGSEASKDALALAKAHAKVFNDEIEVVRAEERSADLDYSSINRLEQKLENEIKALMNGAKIPFTTTLLVSSSSAGEEIVRHLTIKDSREICLGVRRRSKVGKLLFGSTAQYVILNAPCPVVTIR